MRRAIFGLCMLCALAISAVAAQGAFAQEYFTCAAGTGSTGFTDAHCKSRAANSSQVAFVHQAFTGTTLATLSSETTQQGAWDTTFFVSIQAGVILALQSTKATGPASIMNSGGSSFASAVITYENVTVTAPAGKGCVVTGGKVVTKELAATTAGLTNELKFTPASGSVFGEFTVTGCSIAALNHVYKLEGSVKGQTEGATTNFTKANTRAQGTLKLAGQVAELEGTLTLKGANGNGLALT